MAKERPPKPAVPFDCPRCGRTLMLAEDKKRKFCPECNYKVQRERFLAFQKEQSAAEKEEAARRARERERAKRERKRAELEAQFGLAEKRAADAAFNAKIDIQRKQCEKCFYYAHHDGHTRFCHYCIHTGELRDKGNGPGDCRSFLKRRRMTKSERMAFVRRRLDEVEGAWGGKGKRDG